MFEEFKEFAETALAYLDKHNPKAYDDDNILSECRSTHFHDGVSDAVASAQTTLRLAYDRATQKYSDDYQEVLGAFAIPLAAVVGGVGFWNAHAGFSSLRM